ncbi:MAG: ricin-type beta-trefoil lectin domain protein [Solirubrobacteraceae bacterium]
MQEAELPQLEPWSCGALGGANQKWTRTRAGQIRYATTDRCARIGASGQLELGMCSISDPAQLFVFTNGRIEAANDGGRCLDVIGPS